MNDPYVKKSKAEGRRSRAAYKLIQINEKFDLLRPNQVVLDLGAAPGSWSEVVNQIKGNKVIAVDKLEMDPISGVEILNLDLSSQESFDRIRKVVKEVEKNEKDTVIIQRRSIHAKKNIPKIFL